MRNILRLSIALAVIGAAPALAQGTARERSDCMADALKFCSSDIPFVSEIEDCLRTNMGKLSRACRREFAGPTQSTKLREEHFQ